jgi:hypothetical protein
MVCDPVYVVAMLLNASRAVSDETANDVPAVALEGAVTTKFEGEPWLTEIVALPTSVGDVAEAVSVALSGFTRVAVSVVVLTPEVKETEVAGSVGAVPFGADDGPDHAIVCAPVYEVAVLLNVSRAVSVTVNEVPAVALVGAETRRFAAEPAATVIGAEPEGPAVSDAVSVRPSALTSVAFRVVVLTPAVNETEVVGYVGAVPLGALPAPVHAMVCAPAYAVATLL